MLGKSIRGPLNRIIGRKTPLWVTLLLLVGAMIGAIAFGAIVRERAIGKTHLGRIGDLSYGLAAFPSEMIRAFKLMIDNDMASMTTEHPARFPGQSGWTFFDAGTASGLDGYLVFSRYDGDAGHHVLELVDLKAGEVVHRIDIDAARVFAGTTFATRKDHGLDPARFRAVHPLPLENGDVLIKSMVSPIVRMTPCGAAAWVLEEEDYHHAIERGPEGDFWATGHIRPQVVPGMSPFFFDPSIVRFSADGKVVYHRSLTQLMLDQGLGFLILGAKKFYNDPLHMNDVQPVFSDGPYWKRGDLLLSLRHPSTIMLFRPSTDQILWWKQGPWASQHDVDVINDTTIGVFNNNAYNFGDSDFVDGQNHVTFYDFSTDKVTSPFAEMLKAQDVRTEAEGLFSLLPDGHLFVEETEAGRTLFFTPAGELAAQNVNRADKNGLIYHLGWSRYLTRAEGDKLRAQWKAAVCN